MTNLKIIFTPLDNNLDIDPKEVENNITDKTKIILVTHLMGRQQKYIKKIAEIAKKYNLILIEDIAQSFGVGISGSRAGTYGDFAYSSLNHHKILSTGDGGLAITKNLEIFKGIQSLHDQGCVIDEGKRKIPTNPIEGFSMRVNELTAAAAYAQLIKFNYIKSLIYKTYYEIDKIVKSLLMNIEEIKPSAGDIPFFYLFRSKEIKNENYPSLLDSGWHYAANIPYLRDEFLKQKSINKKLEETEKILSETFVIGSGLVDKYYSSPIGLNINYNINDKNNLINNIKQII